MSERGELVCADHRSSVRLRRTVQAHDLGLREEGGEIDPSDRLLQRLVDRRPKRIAGENFGAERRSEPRHFPADRAHPDDAERPPTKSRVRSGVATCRPLCRRRRTGHGAGAARSGRWSAPQLHERWRRWRSGRRCLAPRARKWADCRRRCHFGLSPASLALRLSPPPKSVRRRRAIRRRQARDGAIRPRQAISRGAVDDVVTALSEALDRGMGARGQGSWGDENATHRFTPLQRASRSRRAPRILGRGRGC